MSAKPEKTPVGPPAERTIGQLVAETLRFYGQRFWPCLALGIGPALLTVVAAKAPRDTQITVLLTGWPVLMTLSYVAACFLVFGRRFERGRAATAALVGLVVVIPVPVLIALFVLPAVLWLGLLGLAVPVAVVEGTAVRESIRRGFALGRTDYAHAAGTIATLVLLVALTQLALFQLLHGLSQQAVLAAAFMASLVISPLLFIGSAQLYSDQAARARVKSARS
jgi:hypothetical protein